MNICIHIVSFDIPFPANYGGVIDVFYKIRALHREGVRIHLHCFTHRRLPAPELEQFCESVHYYPRTTGLKANLSLKPYIVSSRMSQELLKNLLKDDHPVLFEGLHTCGFISDRRLNGRLLIYRESNIEHHYYYHLFGAEKNPWKKIYFLAESLRLKLFQSVLNHASLALTVSQEDTTYLAKAFPQKQVYYLPSFHGHDEMNILTGRGNYALYHGKLSVAENSHAAEFLIKKVWEDSFPELIVAGLDPPLWLKKLAEKRHNISFIENPSNDAMQQLIRQAHINIMVTFQPTGLKLKLLNALYNGRFCLVNPQMVTGTSLGNLCKLASTPGDFKLLIPGLFRQDFSKILISERKTTLFENYSDLNNCKRLVEILTLPT
ncbi:MAG: glycosyltransferase family 1 protein [Bacteroidetes bacterium]|nr:glycosyltransferase family 1 protein [Bacteroidota bacterium]